jgi:cyclohexanone monooxygenase
MGLRAVAVEAGGDVGGTWYWNRYPGARCDIESMEYSFSFDDELQQDWHWTERYATQPEILRYANHVADRYGLRELIRFDTRVTSAHYDAPAGCWTVRTAGTDGATGTITASFVVMATGCLSSTNTPDFPGLDTFTGLVHHTGRWPHDGVDFGGQRVGVIGTGSSAIQSIPVIAEQAGHLTVFQRTANYAVPAHNRPLLADEEADVKAHYGELRAANRQMIAAYGSRLGRNDVSALAVDDDERERLLDDRWAHGGLPFLGAFNDFLLDRSANDLAAEYVRAKIRSVVDDPAVAERLSPTSVIGCKRLCVDTGYYATFNRPNVTLVDVSDAPIERITQGGVVTGGVEYELDMLVLATGFDAMTGALAKIDIRGRDGIALADAWSAGPRTYLGLSSAGFPNLFLVTGPGSPSVLTNMLVSIEQHVEWITDCIAALRDGGHTTIEATLDAQDAWVEHVNLIAGFTLFPSCNSWYLGANVPGKPRGFMPLIGYPDYAARCADVAAAGYEGFVVS